MSILCKRVVTLTQVWPEIGKRMRQIRNHHSMVQDIIERKCIGFDSVKQLQIFAERESLQMLHHHTPAQIRLSFRDIQNRRACESHSQVRVGVVNLFQLPWPAIVFVDLVNEEVGAAIFHKFIRQINESVRTEVGVVGGYVQVMPLFTVLIDVL